jgi:hypothetical protein
MTISEIIIANRERWLQEGKVVSIEAINWGPCARFAAEVCSQIPGAIPVWDEEIDTEQDIWVGCHCFVVFEGRYYDATCPEGVDKWWRLPYFKGEEWRFET